MADNETPPSVPEVTEQTSQQATDTMPAGEDVLDSESEKMPENMASPEEILGPQAPRSEVLTSLKDYPAEGKKQDRKSVV